MDTLDKLLTERNTLNSKLNILEKKIRNIIDIDKEAFTYVMANFLSDIAREIVGNRYKIREICCRADGVYYISIENNMDITRINPSFTSKVEVTVGAKGISCNEITMIRSKAIEYITRRMDDRKKGDL